MQNLRIQLLLSHLLLVVLMTFVMTGAVVSFFRLGGSIDRILRNNYASVVAAQNMKEALERQDSAATFYLTGNADLARRQLEENIPRYEQSYQTEAHNVTEAGEQAIADEIGRLSVQYRSRIDHLLNADPPLSSAQAKSYYFTDLKPIFLLLKQRIQDVLDLNQAAIVRADLRARLEAEQAARTGIMVTLGASVAATLLAMYRINQAVAPIRLLAAQAEQIGAGQPGQRIEVDRSDEIGMLAASFNEMSEKLAAARLALYERLQRAERMSDAALESLYDPVLVADAQGRIVHLNRAAEGLFGTEERAAGRDVRDVVPQPRIATAVERAIRLEHVSAEEGEGAFVSLPIGSPEEDAARTYRLRVTPMLPSDLSPGAPVGAVAVLEDVTYLRDLDRMKSEFISVASHELRTPVTSLLLATQLLQAGAAGPLSEAQSQIVAAQREDLERLQQMLRDLLDLTRLEAGATPPRLEIIAACDLIDPALDTMRATARDRGIQLERDEVAPAAVRADKGQIGRVLVNLLSNAIRHTPAGGHVRIGAHLDTSVRQVRLTVRDTGSGIPPAYLPRIFERFVQVPGATRGGAGLGLSIARNIVRSHGGEITAESRLGEGSTFTVTLPAAEGE